MRNIKKYKILICISNLGKMPFSKIYVPTPSLFLIILYYLTIGTTLYMYKVYAAKKPNIAQIRVRNLIAIIKMKIRFRLRNLNGKGAARTIFVSVHT